MRSDLSTRMNVNITSAKRSVYMAKEAAREVEHQEEQAEVMRAIDNAFEALDKLQVAINRN